MSATSTALTVRDFRLVRSTHNEVVLTVTGHTAEITLGYWEYERGKAIVYVPFKLRNVLGQSCGACERDSSLPVPYSALKHVLQIALKIRDVGFRTETDPRWIAAGRAREGTGFTAKSRAGHLASA